MQTLTNSKVITPVVHRENGRVEIEYMAEFDGQLIGFFPTQGQAENELNQHVLDLCERGLVDQPLALQAEQALLNANPAADLPMQMSEGDILDTDGMRVALDSPAIVRKVIVAWHKERAQCAYWLAAFSDDDRRRLAEAVIAYRAQFFASELTIDRLLTDWERAIADLLPPRPAATLRAA